MENIHLKQFGINGREKGKFIIVLCSKWCRSCKLLAKKLNAFMDEWKIGFKEIDISENGQLAAKLNITAIPALIFFEDGILLNKDIEMYGELIVRNGVMIGSFNDNILGEIINRI
ncbi:MAG: putative Thioredoxin C-1 [Promethearchaeota archaeon]|nr:MAG: putative Thioredoxin C-1 [Candidatus Lokiarchaeota archaeon]